ncbi:MAG: hypothetical protein ACOX1F_01585 [Erysipelotrichaceae bacterium]|jgi:hypothetical protein
MLLLEVKEEKGWLLSTFNLTYAASWENICMAVSRVYDYYDNVEVLADDKMINIDNKDDILKLEEKGKMTIRGTSRIIKTPMMIEFFNQLKIVNVTIPIISEEFREMDYKKFNLSLGEYMDSIEIAMYC